MISELCTPVMVVELLVVVSVLEDARLAVESRSVLPLPAHADELLVSNLVAALVARGCAPPVAIHRADCIELLVGHELSLLADLPVDDNVDALESR